MNGFPFSFVEKEVNRRYTKLEPISPRTLLKDMPNLTVRVEKDIVKELPKKFSLVNDGWSDMGTSIWHFTQCIKTVIHFWPSL